MTIAINLHKERAGNTKVSIKDTLIEVGAESLWFGSRWMVITPGQSLA